ncbi:type I-G CRISPR-associated helicase/endonuclease Cas3g [Actinoplanes awajinensis]|uniref:HD Cas3-type domain-containing protein n=1 Tax=Actinoplanes awajinensis subsp. mycoplanecinus TaxID=135947 RepID=A0A124G9M9_9ACTN|nr:type I-U CRISPR-associated helicase/endonuclease Cas3 [Actinoplanes awajinensis]KUL29470.1 hypothetical protein ADL15_28055 [Actinoplanes awajinensis subsp. mycoplanecinus]
MTSLTAADFPAFLQAVHGRSPFPWQVTLVEQVLRDGRWPDLIDVPTGLGKTTMIDISVFVAAATAGDPAASRVGRRRCFFVVDRRLVVDEAWEHATALADALTTAERDEGGGVVGRVATALRTYAPTAGDDLLTITRMRGGTTWDADWLDRPDRPGIVLGTVDQVGSRLLFRGYGVSDRRKPIDAALVGTDALLLVDEAHLSTALLGTVAAIQQRDELGLPLPGLAIAQLSATGVHADHPFALDVAAHRDDPVAWQRLTAHKRLGLLPTTAKGCAAAMADTAVERLAHLSSDAAAGVAPAVLVVCNTVDRARDVHSQVLRRLPKDTAATCDLLIGRCRPADRGAPQAGALGALHVSRPSGSTPAILVATQTVEVGVNIDSDALITESASWDALVQRLGRLNRLGRFAERYPTEVAATATVVHDGQADGPVYGAARDTTWTALTEAIAASPDGDLDVSPLACRELSRTLLGSPATRREPHDAPVLLTPTLDAWVQTAPVPLVDPPVAAYLHGFDGGVAPVQVLWRSGLVSDNTVDDPFEDGPTELDPRGAAAILAQFPPRTAEIIEVPWFAARQWMLGQDTEVVGDLESEPDPGRARPSAVRDRFRALAQRPARQAGRGYRDGDAEWRWTWIEPESLRPGDLIIVPTERGGLDRYGWAPREEGTVVDASEPAGFMPQRGRRPTMLRLDDALADRLRLPDEARVHLRRMITAPSRDGQHDDKLFAGSPAWQTLGKKIGRQLPPQPPPGISWPPAAWERLILWWKSGRLSVVELVDGSDAVTDSPAKPVARLLCGPAGNAEDADAQPERDDEEPAGSSRSSRQVTLAHHHEAVGRRGWQIAEAMGLPADLQQVIESAGGWHDLGKVEERFQIMLHGGDPREAEIAPEPLAKSGLDPANRQAWRRSTRISGLPPGARHEAWSAALVAEHLREHPHPGDTDLLVHLVAAHHGYARPLARLVVDPGPRPVVALIKGHKTVVDSDKTVDLDQPARFARLNARYGRWGLALLEAIVRCADMTVSQEGS